MTFVQRSNHLENAREKDSRRDVNGADTMISRLSQLLRMTLANIGKDESSWRKTDWGRRWRSLVAPLIVCVGS